jgi:hypothetical protein
MNRKHIFKDINFDNVIIEYFNMKVNLKYFIIIDKKIYNVYKIDRKNLKKFIEKNNNSIYKVTKYIHFNIYY